MTRRWGWPWQFTLKSLLLLVLLMSLALALCRWYLQPYWRQQATAALIERLGGSYDTVEVTDSWQRLVASHQDVIRVNLSDCDDPDGYISAIAKLPAIESLIVGGPAFGDEHAMQLHRLRTLRDLMLNSTGLTSDGLAALRKALPNADIRLSQRRAVTALAKSGAVILMHRHISSPQPIPSPQPWSYLSDEWFDSAAFLEVRNPDFNDRDAAHITHLSELRQLLLRNTGLTDAALCNLTTLQQLRWLNLAATGVTDAGLANLTHFVHLKELWLEDTTVSDNGLEHLKRLKALQSLYLDGTYVSDTGIQHLIEMPRLQRLSLIGSRVTTAGVVKLRQALPTCNIQFQ